MNAFIRTPGFAMPGAGTLQWKLGTDFRYVFPLVYADGTPFTEELTGAQFNIGPTADAAEADLLLRKELGPDVTVEEVEGVRSLVIALRPDDAEGLDPVAAFYSVVIQWGVDRENLIAEDRFILAGWVGR